MDYTGSRENAILSCNCRNNVRKQNILHRVGILPRNSAFKKDAVSYLETTSEKDFWFYFSFEIGACGIKVISYICIDI